MQANSNQALAADEHSPPMTTPRLQVGRLSAAALLVLVVVSVATRSYAVSGLVFGLGGFLALRNLGVFVGAAQRDRWLLLGSFLLLTITFPLALLRSETAFVHYFVTLLSLLVAFLLTRSTGIYWYASRAVLYVSLAIVSAYLLSSGLEGFPLEQMIPDSSSNGITSYLVILQANYCVASYLYRGRLPVFSPLLTLGICVVGYGRGSILSAVLIISISLVTFALRKSPRHFFMAVGLFAVTAMGAATVYGDEIGFFIEANTKIGSGLYDAHRDAIIKDYGARLDDNSLTLLTGADYRGTVIESDYNMNPHNSYIRAHHIFGLPYLLVVLLFPFLSSWGKPMRERVFPLALLVVMLFRAATEPILFPTMLDIFYFSVCFLMGMPKNSHPSGSKAHG